MSATRAVESTLFFFIANRLLHARRHRGRERRFIATGPGGMPGRPSLHEGDGRCVRGTKSGIRGNTVPPVEPGLHPLCRIRWFVYGRGWTPDVLLRSVQMPHAPGA